MKIFKRWHLSKVICNKFYLFCNIFVLISACHYYYVYIQTRQRNASKVVCDTASAISIQRLTSRSWVQLRPAGAESSFHFFKIQMFQTLCCERPCRKTRLSTFLNPAFDRETFKVSASFRDLLFTYKDFTCASRISDLVKRSWPVWSET